MERPERYTCPECGGTGEVLSPGTWCGVTRRLYGCGVQVVRKVCAGTGWLERVSGLAAEDDEDG